MGRFRINLFDVAARALGPDLDDPQLPGAIEALSATFREGRHDFVYSAGLRRAAYLVHLLAAHVSDVHRLLLDLDGPWREARALRVVCLGAGPGSEVLGLLEAVSGVREQGDLSELERLEARRVDRVQEWDQSFAAIMPPYLDQLTRRDPQLAGLLLLAGESSLADLARPPLPGHVAEALGEADLVLMCNVLGEIPPRGAPELPDGVRAVLGEVLAALAPQAQWLTLDRSGAPGIKGRLEGLADLARDAGREVREVRERQNRCGSAPTRKINALYERVRLPTTREKDAPVLNSKTAYLVIEPLS